jgi:hypothetical protein
LGVLSKPLRPSSEGQLTPESKGREAIQAEAKEAKDPPRGGREMEEGYRARLASPIGITQRGIGLLVLVVATLFWLCDRSPP